MPLSLLGTFSRMSECASWRWRWVEVPALLDQQEPTRVQLLGDHLYLSRHHLLQMTDKLPPQLLQLFAPRPALRYLPPCDHAPQERRTPAITGVAEYLQAAKEYDDGYVPTESWLQKKDRQRLERDEAARYRVTEGFKNDCAPRLLITSIPFNADLVRQSSRTRTQTSLVIR